MGPTPEYKSVSGYETDATLDDSKHGQTKKSKVDPPRISNISTASSEDFFNLDPKLLPRVNEIKTHQENSQSPHRVDHIVLTRDISFKSEDRVSDITHESVKQNMSPTTQSPPVQVMERHKDQNSKYDPNRIPASVFGSSKSSAPVEWSTASNDSLFSIHLGNNSMSRDHSLHTRRAHGDSHKHEDSYKAGDPLKFRKPFPAMEWKSDYKKSEVENKSGSDGLHTDIRKETIDRSEVRFSPIEISFAPIRRSDGSELDAQDFVAPIKKSGCTMCNCTNCRLTMCACTWPSCCCCSCKWLGCSSCKCPRCSSCNCPSCSSCKWPSCGCCKWLSCSSCKWPSCSSCKCPSCSCCKCPSCSSCKCPSCSSCEWPNCSCCKWLSCSSCKWPSCCSCKWPSCGSCKWLSCSSCKAPSCCCCPCKWPSCCSCGWPSCPKCCNCPCGCPSCSSCSFMCFSWPCWKCSGCSWPSCPKCSSCGWPSCPNCSSCGWPSCPKCSSCIWPSIFCCFSKVSPEDKISDHHKRASNKRSRCCHFPSFSWSWFSCRCC